MPYTRTDASLAKGGPASFHPGPTSPFSLRISRLNSLPSKHKKSSPGVTMPHLVAIARAVLMLSPVTILTVMPARLHLAIASGTCGEWSKRKEGDSAGDAGKLRLVSCLFTVDKRHFTNSGAQVKYGHFYITWCHLTSALPIIFTLNLPYCIVSWRGNELQEPGVEAYSDTYNLYSLTRVLRFV